MTVVEEKWVYLVSKDFVVLLYTHFGISPTLTQETNKLEVTTLDEELEASKTRFKCARSNWPSCT